jgi:hypothetical protein
MATLIQSKQIEGIVTASVVTGEFLVSGSLVVTGSNSILGSVTASAISSSFSGDGSGITGITYSQIGNTPTFVGGNNITITSSSNVITVHATLDGTGSDAQSLSINGDQLTILGGNTVTIPTGSTSWEQLGDVPSGLISSSVQILGGSGILSGSKTDISSLNTFSSSIQSEVDALTAATSSYLTSSGSVDFSDVTNKPSGLVSSSTQITITESQISDLTHYTNTDVRTYIDSIGVVSGSYVESLPQGLISGSTFTDYSSSIQTELGEVRNDLINQFTNADNSLQSSITSLESYTSSIQSEVDSLTSATSSYITEIPQGTISGSQQVIESLPSGVVSGSSQISISSSQITDLAHTQIPQGTISGSEQLPQGLISSSTQITITESQISDLTHYTDSDVQSYLDSLGVVSGSVVAELPSGVISGSEQLPSGLISGSTQVVDSLPSGVVSGSEQLPQGLISGSSQITITESQISDLSHTDISNLNTFTSSIQSEVDSLTAATSSYLTSIDSGIVSSSAQVTELLPSGVISGSEQLPNGLVSGSSQITITESQISDLAHTDITSLNTFTSSIQTQVDGLSSATSSYLTSSGSVDFSDITSLPSGLISGSSQVVDSLPSGTVSGSRQITDGSGLVSSSQQVIDHLPSGVVSGSFSGSVSLLSASLHEVSGANYIESQSVDSRLDTIEGSVGMYYDLSNTVWNNKYIKSGSGEASDTTGFQTGNVPFKFRLNTDRKLHYEVGDVVYLSNFDRDTTITATVSSSYETGSREVGFTVVSVNQSDAVTRINDSYWIISRHTAGFVDSASYTEASASFDYRIDVIVASGSGADWNVNLTNIPSGIVSSSEQQYTASIENGFALTSSLDNVSSSLATRIENVYLSSSNFDAKSLVSSSEQIDFRNVTNYVADEHIDHTTVNINAGDGLDGGGDISSTREIRLNVTSSHFTSGVGDVLTSEGVVKQSTLDADIVGTDFSQSVDNRINAISDAAVPSGTVSGSTQVDITQTQNYTAFSSSIATSIAGVSASPTDISHLNTFTSSVQSQVDELIISSSTFLTSETDSQTLSIVGDQLTISSGNSVTIPTGSGTADFTQLTNVPSGLVSGSDQILGGSDIISGSTFTSFSSSIDSRLDTLENATDNTGSDTQSLSIVGDQLTISDGNTITIPTGSGQSIDTSSFATTGSNTFDGNQIVSGSIIPEATADSNGIHDLGSLSNPFRDIFITTGSVRFVRDGQLVSQVSGERDAIRVGNILITTSSLQIVSGSGNSLTTISTIASADVNEQGEVSNAQQVLLPDGLISGSLIPGTNITIDSASGDFVISSTASGSGDVSYDGNRVISNDKLGDLFTDSVNPGTSGSIQDFLNAVFYPNTGPTITTGNQTIAEYVTSGTTITTLIGTDPEGQAITFGTASAYTDDLVRVASNGVMTLNALAESSSFNTDLVSGVHGHKVEVTATDSFGTTTEKDIYVIVTPNSTPVFRETSTSGNIITSVTANLNENSTNDTLVKRIYFTDANGDSITIYSSSIDNNHFDITKYSTYVDIRQNTGSLDYEQQTSYTFSISASDEHYEAGQDTDSIVTLPITINVVDNVVPTVSDQTLSSINENSSNGATVGSISAADSEGDTITFKNFQLHQLQLDGVEVSSGSYSGTSQLTDPHEEPFQMSTSGVVTRKTGVYLNSDLINRYIYRVKVTDSYNTDSEFSLVTINITDDTPATLSDNWSAGPYIKESEVSGTTIKTTNYGSTAADYGSNQSGTWNSSNSAISINSNGTLSLGVDLSGSVTQSGDTLDSTITFTNTFGTTTTDSLSLTIVVNDAPTATFTNQSSNFNTNLATENTNLVSVSISDTESDTPYQLTIGGTNGSSINAVPQNSASSSWQLQASSDLSAATYSYDVTVTDNYGKSTSYNGRSFEILQASSGTMTENGTFYIIESATNGNLIRTNSNGRTGTQGAVVVSYSPNYGSQVATSFSSSNELISVNSSTGQLSVGTDISGSGNTNGSIIATTITWTDQYGNEGSDAIAVNVSKNNAPTVSSTQTFNTNTNEARGSSEIVRLTLTDTESDTIPNSGLSFSGYNTTYFTPSISTPQMKLLANSTNIPAGTYPYTASIQDVHGFDTTVHSGSVTITQADNGTLEGDTAIYIIESAVSGVVFRDQTGFNQGNAAELSVSYSPNYGSQLVQSYTSSRQGISVDSSGNLTAGYDFSGSVTSTDYTSTALVSDSTNSTLYGKSLHVNGIKIVQGAATGSQSAVPDAFTEKVAQTIKLMVTSSGADINDTDQANMIGILKGETGTWHSGYPTAQRILRGAGSDYSPNPLIDSNYSSYTGLQNFQDSHATNDMIWYLNSSATSGSGDDDIVEVIEHLMHTIHQYGVRGAVSGSYNGLSWDPDTDSDWNTRELYLAIKEAVDDSVFDISDYGDASYNTASTFKLIAKEYLYLLNFNMWEYSSLWDGGSLSPEWNDNSRTPSGIQTNNPLGYALYNKYIKPVLTKPSKTVLQNIFQDGDVGDPTVAGSSGYTPEVGTGLISKITFRDQYDNIGSGSVTATIFGNSSPAASFTATSDYNTDASVSGSTAGTLTVTDTENNSPFTFTLAGTDGGKFDVSGSSSPFTIQPTGSLEEGSYSINITVTDTYGESVTLTGESITVEAAEVLTTVYVYTLPIMVRITT